MSDFITSYVKYDYPKREVYFRLTDFYSKFYLSFIDGRKTTNPHFWQDNLLTPELTAWRGFTFESLCYYHLPQIKQALGISGVQTEVSPWKSRKEKDGAQIDMIIDRADRIINVCEMKFCEDDFSINAAYDKNLRHKLSTFAEETKCRSSLHLTLVTTMGLSSTNMPVGYKVSLQWMICLNNDDRCKYLRWQMQVLAMIDASSFDV